MRKTLLLKTFLLKGLLLKTLLKTHIVKDGSGTEIPDCYDGVAMFKELRKKCEDEVSDYDSKRYQRAYKKIRDTKLPMVIRAKFVGVARELYVDAEPHEEECYLRVLRKWNEVETKAQQVRNADASGFRLMLRIRAWHCAGSSTSSASSSTRSSASNRSCQ